MKKSLSFLLALTLVFSMFSSLAFAATDAEKEAGAALKELGLLDGNTQGDLMLDSTLKRQDAIALLTKMIGKKKEAESYTGGTTFADVKGDYYKAVIGYAQNAGLVKGYSAKKFGFNELLDTQAALALTLRTLGYDVAWNEVGAKAVELGLVAEGTDLKAPATRGAVALASYNALDVPMAGSDVTLAEKLGLNTVSVVSAEAVSATKVVVGFSDGTEATVEVELVPNVEKAVTVKHESGKEFKVDVTYELTVKSVVALDEENVEVTFSDDTVAKFPVAKLTVNEEATREISHLGAKFQVKVKLAALEIKTVTQTGAKTLEVALNAAAKADAKVTVKSGFLPLDGKVTFSEDRKTVTFEANVAFTNGKLSVEVSDVAKATEVEVKAPVVTKVEITSTHVQATTNIQDINYKVYDQFNGEMAVAPSAFTASAYNVNKGVSYTLGTSTNPNKFTLTGPAAGTPDNSIALDNNIMINLFHNATGKTAQATFKAVAGSVVTKIEIGTVEKLANTDRITVGQTHLVLPVKLFDQYNNEIAVSGTTLRGVTFVSSDPAKLTVANGTSTVDLQTYDGTNDFGVIANTTTGKNEVRFTAKAAGDVTVRAFIPTSGAQASTTITINAAVGLNSVQLNQPSALFVANEPIEVTYVAQDQFNTAIKLAAETNPRSTQDQNDADEVKGLTFFSNNLTVLPYNAIAVDANGKLTITPAAAGQATLNVYLSNGTPQGTLTFDVKEAAKATKITGVKADALVRFVNGGSYSYKATDLTIVDQYNRVMKDTQVSDANLTITEKTAADDKVSITGARQVNGSANLGSQILVATYEAGTEDPTFEFTVTTVALNDVVGYDVDIPANKLIFTGAITRTDSHAKKIVIKNGKDANGNKIAVNTTVTAADVIVTGDASIVVGLDSTNGTDPGNAVVFASGTAVTGKEAIVTVVKNGKIVAQEKFITSDATKAVDTISFNDTVEKEISGAVNSTINVLDNVVAKDQYGVDIAVTGVGNWYSSDTNVLTVNNGTITKAANVDAAKTITITYVTTNAKTLALQVTVK